MAKLEATLDAFSDRYGKLGFAVDVLNTILLVMILLK
jgi:hypothetical protein